MKIYDVLKKDHEAVRSLFSQLMAFEQMKPEIVDENILQTTLRMAANLMPARLSKTVLDKTRGQTL